MLDIAEARMLLGVSPVATPAEVTAAFRRRVRALHPDAGGPGGDIAAFVAARKVLLRACAEARNPYRLVTCEPRAAGRLFDRAA